MSAPQSKLVDVTDQINDETSDEDENASNADDVSSASGTDTSDVDSQADDSDVDDAGGAGGDDEEEEDEGGKKPIGEGDEEEDEEEEIVAATTAKQKKSARKRGTGPASKKNIEDDLTLLGVPHGLNFDDDDDEDSDDSDGHDDEEYFQKMKSDVRQNFAESYHPESFSHNYDEIQTLAKVVRNSSGVIIDDLHRTIPILTKYEKTRILGQRTKQINEGANPLIKIDSTVIDGYLIAVKELEQKKTPFIIRRPLPNGGSEYWRIQDLEII
jgi:DNA-directed RNA polymerase subunit K/omega